MGEFVPSVRWRCEVWLLNLLEVSLPVRESDSELSWSQRCSLEADRQTGWTVDWSLRETYSNSLD